MVLHNHLAHTGCFHVSPPVTCVLASQSRIPLKAWVKPDTAGTSHPASPYELKCGECKSHVPPQVFTMSPLQREICPAFCFCRADRGSFFASKFSVSEKAPRQRGELHGAAGIELGALLLKQGDCTWTADWEPTLKPSAFWAVQEHGGHVGKPL